MSDNESEHYEGDFGGNLADATNPRFPDKEDGGEGDGEPEVFPKVDFHDYEGDEEVTFRGEGPRERPARRQTRFFVKPDKYDGGSGFAKYLSHFEDCAELGQWDDDVQVVALASCLTGPARSFYMTLPRSTKRDYAGLVKALAERFDSTRLKDQWVMKLESRTLLSSEGIADFADDLRLIASRAYPLFAPDVQETLALQQFLRGIPFEMKLKCIDRDCADLHTAVEIVSRYEGLLGPKKKVRAVTKAEPTEDSSDESILSQSLRQVMLATQEILKEVRAPQTASYNNNYHSGNNQRDSRRSGDRQPRKCWDCGELGHIRYECPLNKKQNSSNQVSSPENGQPPRQ
jgi:hypothetical protein